MPPDREAPGLLRELLPGEERVARRAVAGGQERVGGDDAGEAVGVLGDEAQPDAARPSPGTTSVMSRRSSWSNSTRAQPVDVALVRVVGRARAGLSERPKPTRSGATHAEPGADEHRDHLAVEVAPRRLAVQQQHRPAVGAGPRRGSARGACRRRRRRSRRSAARTGSRGGRRSARRACGVSAPTQGMRGPAEPPIYRVVAWPEHRRERRQGRRATMASASTCKSCRPTRCSPAPTRSCSAAPSPSVATRRRRSPRRRGWPLPSVVASRRSSVDGEAARAALHRRQPPPRRVDRQALPVAGDCRCSTSSRRATSASCGPSRSSTPHGLQVLDVRDVVDPPGASRGPSPTRAARSGCRRTSSEALSRRSPRTSADAHRTARPRADASRSSPRPPGCRPERVADYQAAVHETVSLSAPIGDDAGRAGRPPRRRRRRDARSTPPPRARARGARRRARPPLRARARASSACASASTARMPRTLEDVGREFALTRERIRQIEAKALTKLRHPCAPPALRQLVHA